MTAITNSIASDRKITVWVVPETVQGVLAYPLPKHIVAPFDISYPVQVPDYENSKERANSRDVLDRCQGSMPAGEWGFSTYCRPNEAGVVPAEAELLKSLLGKETIVASTSVDYEPAIDKPSVSIWFMVDHTMLFISGATVGKGECAVDDDCQLIWKWSGGFMRMGVTGTQELEHELLAAEDIILTTNTNRYTVGGVICLTDAAGAVVDDNSGAGYEIISIVDGVSITVDQQFFVGAAAGGFIAPLNVGGAVQGLALEQRTATVTIGGVVKKIVGFTFVVTDEPEYLSREKTPSGYPENYAETQREVSGEVGFVFRRDDSEQFKLGIVGADQAIILNVGSTAGYLLEIEMPRCQIEVPSTEDVEPLVEIKRNYTALATVGEDSVKVTYK